MIILENRKEKTASFCNNDLKHLVEFTDVVVLIDDNGEWITICPTSNDYVFLKTRTNDTTIIRTDSVFNPYISFVYDIEVSEDEEDDEEPLSNDNIGGNGVEGYYPIYIDRTLDESNNVEHENIFNAD